MINNNLTSPIGLARYAREYFDAAIAADDKIGNRAGYEVTAPPPVMFLVAHAIELSFKSYLLHCGWDLKSVIGLGHDLTVIWQKAVENGVENIVELSKEEVDVLSLISDLHKSTELRYIKTGFKQFPVFGPLEQLSRKILDGICPHVGYK